MLSAKRKTRIQNCVFIVVSLCCALFLFWKCRYGFADWDESFYLTIPLRLLRGDCLILDEWNITQMSSLLLLPFVRIYRLLHNGTEGILLSFRYLYTSVQLLASAFVYFSLKKYHKTGAFLAALLFALYAPFGIMALSYNSLGILCLTVALLLLLNANGRFVRGFLAGLFIAAAVLCFPYLAAVYVLYSVFAVVYVLVRHERKSVIFSDWIHTLIGVAIPAIAVFILLLKSSSPGELFAVISDIVHDPEHPAQSAPQLIDTYVRHILFSSDHSKYLFAGYFVCLIGLLFKKKLKKWAPYFLILSLILTGLYMVSIFVTNRFLNHLILPLSVEAFFLFLYSDDPAVRSLFLRIWIPGMLFSFCVHCSSNQEFTAISSASAVALPASVLMLSLTADTFRKKQGIPSRAVPVFILCLFGLQLGFESYSRYESVFWETSMSDMTVNIPAGAEKGLITSPKKADIYAVSRQDAAEILKNRECRSILCLSESVWMYLDMPDLELRSYSAWLYGLTEFTIPNLQKYYAMERHSLPDAVYTEKENAGFADAFRSIYGYSETKLNSGNILLIKP